MEAVFACPAGWLLESLVGHPLDAKLFIRRSLWWHYRPEAWRGVTHGDAGFERRTRRLYDRQGPHLLLHNAFLSRGSVPTDPLPGKVL